MTFWIIGGWTGLGTNGIMKLLQLQKPNDVAIKKLYYYKIEKPEFFQNFQKLS